MKRIEWDVVVVGGANQDFLVRGGKLPRPGETTTGKEFRSGTGGKGANQAVAAARLGARTAFVGKVGKGPEGDAILDQLETEGVDTRWVLRDEHARSGVALISVDDQGEKQIHAAPGANLKLTPQDVFTAGTAITRSRVVLTQLEIPVESAYAAIRLGSGSRASVMLDPAPAQALPDDLFLLLDVIRLNSVEAEFFTGVPVHDHDSARLAAERLLWKGVRSVIVQAGEDNLLVHRETELWLPRYSVQSVDSTGAGDAFSGAVAAGLSAGYPIPDAALFGSAAAALATTVIGAQPSLPTRSDVQRLLEKDGIRLGERRLRPTAA